MHRQTKRISDSHMTAYGVVLIIAVTAASLSCSDALGVSDGFEEGSFESGDIELHYVIDFPSGPGPFPAVVFGHGSGEKDIEAYEAFAERAVQNGIAMLRYDKRGVGKSGGTHVRSSNPAVNQFIPLLAGDMAAAATFLAQHQRVDAGRLGLMGESQAGWVIPLAAASAPDVDFVLPLSGPTLPLGQVGAFEALATADPDGDLNAFADQVANVEDGFDPRQWIRDLTVPGLWIYGARDVHVPAKTSVEFLQGLVETTGKNFTTIVYPNGDHGLRDNDTRDPINYWVDLLEWFDAVIGR